MRRPVLKLLRGGRSTVRARTVEWLNGVRRQLKALALEAQRNGDTATFETLVRTRDALARLEGELAARDDGGAP